MNKKERRARNKLGRQRSEEKIRARLAGRKGGIAPWKILVPAMIVLFLLHCRAWHPEEELLLCTAFSTGSYRSLNTTVGSVLLVTGICGWMSYVYLRKDKNKERGGKWFWKNILYGFFWGTALLALCTNVAVVSLFWLNTRYTSGNKPRDYRIAGVEIHDRKPKSFLSRYSASLLLNTFSYGELFVEGEGYTRINVSPHIARQLSGLQGAYLKIDLADGCLGWGVVKKIYPIATVCTPLRDETSCSAPSRVGQETDSSGQTEKEHTFLYTWRDIHIFAELRNINLSDTTHVSVNRYVDASRDLPVWEIDVRDSVQADKARVILIHGETGEVLMDSYE
jgi:hypothetical protein